MLDVDYVRENLKELEVRTFLLEEDCMPLTQTDH